MRLAEPGHAHRPRFRPAGALDKKGFYHVRLRAASAGQGWTRWTWWTLWTRIESSHRCPSQKSLSAMARRGRTWLNVFLCASLRLCARLAVSPWAGISEVRPMAPSGKSSNPGFGPAGCACLPLECSLEGREMGMERRRSRQSRRQPVICGQLRCVFAPCGTETPALMQACAPLCMIKRAGSGVFQRARRA